MKRLLKRKVGLVFLLIQVLLTLVLIGFALYIDMIPAKYLLIGILALVFLLTYVFFSQMTKHFHIVGRVVSALVSLLLLLAILYMGKGYMTLSGISNTETKIDEMSIIVRDKSKAQEIGDTGSYLYGIVSEVGREYTDKALKEVNKNFDTDVATKEYADVSDLVDALYAKEVKAIVFNEAYREIIKEQHEKFDTQTRVLVAHQVETKVEVDEAKKSGIISQPFHVYISGIDAYGDISKTSRSDVNVIATINPTTHEVLLTSTPRDAYVPLSISKGVKDKLTHAGMYGVDCSIKTLEMLYGIDISYYARVNFSGVTNIVNALGGVKVYSDYTFTSDWGPSFKKGYNQVNGKQALAFARERHHFAAGDRQRGKNHEHLIKAVVDKATSPSILKNFNGFMDSISGAFETNMSTEEITDLVKYQMAEMPEWKFTSISADGTGMKDYTYTYKSRRLYVMNLKQSTVDNAKDKMKQVIEGVKISEEDSDKKAKASPSVSPKP